jgi:acyl dehydratase
VTYGRYFEEFEPGATYQHWPGKTVTEYDHHHFCLLTMIRHPLHTDHHFARTFTRHGRPLVVSPLIFALLTGLSEADIAGVALAHRGFANFEHRAPLFHGDTLYARTRVLAVRPVEGHPARGAVHARTEGINQHGELIAAYDRQLEVPRGRHPLAPPRGRHSRWPFSGDDIRHPVTDPPPETG